MSEFQAGLLAIGLLAVAAVFGYNKWQEHRAGRAADESFRSRHPDVLTDARPEAVQSPSAHQDNEPRVEPVLASRSPVLPASSAADGAARPVPDARVDYVIEMSGDAPAGAMLSEAWAPIENRFARRASLIGLVDDRWMPAGQGLSSGKLEAALQLVSRKGVLSESELLEFRSAVETMAAKLQFVARAPEMKDALEAARLVDGVCAEADIQVAFHVVAAPGAVFAGTKVRAAAEAAGFALDGEGRFALHDEDGRKLYELSDRDGTKFLPATMKDAAPQALTLSMDVPRAPDTQRTFDAMVRFGRQLANLLGGGLVDDNNQPLDEKAVSAINSQLMVVRRSLETQGIAPGSPLALRLFS